MIDQIRELVKQTSPTRQRIVTSRNRIELKWGIWVFPGGYTILCAQDSEGQWNPDIGYMTLEPDMVKFIFGY